MTIFKKRTAIIAFMLLAVLVMGIGYAAFSTKLTINGTAGVDAGAVEFTEKVVFTAASSDNTTFGKAVVGTDFENPASESDVASFDVFGMTKANETVKFTYTITNGSDVPVSIDVTTKPTTTATDSKFTVSQSLTAPVEVAAGATTTITITVILKEDVTAALDPVSYVIAYTATGVDTP